MIQTTITREQELTVHVVVVILAVVSLAYGITQSNVFWLAVAPTVLIGGLAFFARRPGSQIGGKVRPRREPDDSILARLDTLERFAKLYRDGVLTAEEFESEKRKMLKTDA